MRHYFRSNVKVSLRVFLCWFHVVFNDINVLIKILNGLVFPKNKMKILFLVDEFAFITSRLCERGNGWPSCCCESTRWLNQQTRSVAVVISQTFVHLISNFCPFTVDTNRHIQKIQQRPQVGVTQDHNRRFNVCDSLRPLHPHARPPVGIRTR